MEKERNNESPYAEGKLARCREFKELWNQGVSGVWWNGSSARVPTYHSWGSEFTPQCWQKKRTGESRRRIGSFRVSAEVDKSAQSRDNRHRVLPAWASPTWCPPRPALESHPCSLWTGTCWQTCDSGWPPHEVWCTRDRAHFSLCIVSSAARMSPFEGGGRYRACSKPGVGTASNEAFSRILFLSSFWMHFVSPTQIAHDALVTHNLNPLNNDILYSSSTL